MGLSMTTKPDGRQIHAALIDVALVDAKSCAAPGGVSLAWWYAEVRTGRAPAPTIRRPRFTRWRLTDVRKFWAELSEKSGADSEAAEFMTARATKASAAARKPEAIAKATSTRARHKAERDAGLTANCATA